ncbi:hypothetical protein BX600DRAFT_433057 [Xylariales sp. PMI_506]|nr:hypothetical protein BX600DRAFT_433057 [Xylariales sp. PMI_506]
MADENESRSAEVIAVAWVFTGIAFAVVLLKLFARAHIVKKLGWDDFFIFFSMALSIVASALVTWSAVLGFGQHTTAVAAKTTPDTLYFIAKIQMLGYPFNIGAFSFPNISIAILVNHILDPNIYRSTVLYAMVIIQVGLAMGSVMVVFLQCHPTERLWNPTVDGYCLSPNVLNDYSYFLSSFTILTDVVLAIVPISVFWKLQMRQSTKIGLCIMMGLTMLSAIVTIVKATYLYLFTDKSDPLWDVVPLVLWGLTIDTASSIEQNVVIVAACIPTLRPFFHKPFQSKKGTGNSGSGGSKYSNNLSMFSINRKPGKSSIPLETVERDNEHDDTESQSSQQGIVRTLDVQMEWH